MRRIGAAEEPSRAGISGSTAREIATSAEAAIRDGRVRTGQPLPTVRSLASALGTSPATVNAAYRTLRERGLVIAEGRRGTRVAPRPALRTSRSPRAERSVASLPTDVRDLTIGLPDPALLPPIAPALERIDLGAKMRTDLESADPDLIEFATAWFRGDGIPARELGLASGAFDAMERVLDAHLRPGDRVIIEDPAYGSIRDLLLALRLVPVPVAVDESGPLPDRLAASLAKGADAMVVVPRAQNPLGAALDAERQAQLLTLLEPHQDLLLVEDDHAGVVSGVPCRTIVGASARRWAVIRSVSKVLHPDLRVALLAGDETTIARVEGRQAIGPRWISHVLQALVAELLRDPQFEHISAHASDVYSRRRRALVSALAELGVTAYGRSGLNVWVCVREEAQVVGALVDRGWLVLAGERFRIEAPPGIRITIATLPDHEIPALAEAIAEVEQSGRPRSSY